jgi:hypothetical protein
VCRACGSHRRGEESVQGFGGKARRKETTWKSRVDGKMESELILGGRLAGGL